MDKPLDTTVLSKVWKKLFQKIFNIIWAISNVTQVIILPPHTHTPPPPPPPPQPPSNCHLCRCFRFVSVVYSQLDKLNHQFMIRQSH